MTIKGLSEASIKIKRIIKRILKPVWNLLIINLRSKKKFNILKPNTASEWEREYLTPVKPIYALKHPVACTISELTNKGDVLLEAGCGSGQLSAELAIAGRKIELADFSTKILERAKEVFTISGLPKPKIKFCDLKKPPFPWTERSVDVVWSSGVLEHWTDEEIIPIVTDMARIARKQVISLVPNAGSMFYRLGKYYAEQNGTWPYGKEIPRHSLIHVFEEAGLTNIKEWNIMPEASITFLKMIAPRYREITIDWWKTLSPNDSVRGGQGYLLVTVGQINNHHRSV